MKTYWVYDEELIEDDPYTDPEERMDQTVVILTSDLPAALERVAEWAYEGHAPWEKAHPLQRAEWIDEATKAFYGGEE